MGKILIVSIIIGLLLIGVLGYFLLKPNTINKSIDVSTSNELQISPQASKIAGVQGISNWKTYDKEKVCSGETCTLTLYSGTRFVVEGEKWVNVEDAKSLRNSPIKCVVKSDGITNANCLDWNLTSVTAEVYLYNESYLNKDIPIKVIDAGKASGSTSDSKISFKSSRDVMLITERVSIGKELHIGNESTTISLQDADTENLEDTYISQYNTAINFGTQDYMDISNLTDYNKWGIVKFDISGVPDGATIDDGKLTLYISDNGLDASNEGFNITMQRYMNQSWVETTPKWSTFDFANINGTNTEIKYFFGGAGEPTGALTWNVTDLVIGEPNNNLSIMIMARDLFGEPSITDYVTMVTKEGATASQRPMLNITYHTQCDYTGGNWVINSYCEFTNYAFNVTGNLSINDGGTLNVTNTTISFNSTNQYIIFNNIADENKLILNGYSQIN